MTQPDNFVQAAIEKINVLLENFMGINDVDLGKRSEMFMIVEKTVNYFGLNQF